MARQRTSVLIVGGALTGLSTAVFAAWHGARCVLVERHPDRLLHPRLRAVHPRAVELYRQVGLEEAMRAAAYVSGRERGWRYVSVRARTLADDTYVPAEEERDEGDGALASPCAYVPIDQDRLELLLRERARELGVDVRFSTELTTWQDRPDGVHATLTDLRDGTTTPITADYMVAADGGPSPIRTALGVPSDGPGAFFHTVNVLVEADLTAALRGRRVDLVYLRRPRPGTILLAHDDSGRRWIAATGYDPASGESPADYDDARCAELVRAASGLPDVTVRVRPQIPGTDIRVLAFPIGAALAGRYRVGRIFLAGDAAHLMPPTGGLGGSTAILDAANLGWKLAAVTRGWAGPALLDSYEAEQRPVGALMIGQATARWRARIGGPGGAGASRVLDYWSVILGPRHRSAAVLTGEPDPVPAGKAGPVPAPLLPAELDARPGSRAPHHWISSAGRRISTLDLYGTGLVLVTGRDGAGWVRAADRAGRRLGVPITAHRFGRPLPGAVPTVLEPVDLDVAGLESAHGIDAAGAVLVRPDGYVAWRSRSAVEEDHTTVLERVLGVVLARTAVRATAR